jgi:hypothetical protein
MSPKKKPTRRKAGPKVRQKKAAARKKPRPAARKPAPARAAPRSDFGQPIDALIARQPPDLRQILVALRRLIEQAAPGVKSSLKWGSPFFMLDGKMMCALSAHKAHVNLILVGPADQFADPHGRLAGQSRFGRHLKLTRLADLPRAEVLKWVRTAARYARRG